jgi:hypothetical protein
MDMRKLIVSVAALAAGLAVVGACGAEPTAKKDKGSETAASSCGTESGTGCAPEDKRVDLARPSFSDPTSITNPLFPVSRQESVLMVGRVDGKAFRTEVTLLPDTRIIEWQGQQVETLVSQGVCTRSPTTSTPRPTTDPSGTSARTCSTSKMGPSSTPTEPGSPVRTARQL